jgi:hypothetical protein
MHKRKTAEELRAEARLRLRAELDNERINRLDKIIAQFKRDTDRDTMRALAAEINRLNATVDAVAETVQNTKDRLPIILMPSRPLRREPRD